MAKYYLTNKAVEDLANIWNYSIDAWSEQQADSYYSQLIESCQKLAANPKLGKNYPRIQKSLLGFHVNKHIVFYRIISDDVIEITRILHEMMDLKTRLEK